MRQDFPVEPFNNSRVLSGWANNLKIRYGTFAWGRVEWVGRLYPKGVREAKFLSHYVEHFNSIELQATQHKTYSAAEVEKWTIQAEGKDFLFCPKVPQAVSHFSSFIDVEDKTKAYLDSFYAFGGHLGPVLLQVSDRFSPKRKEAVLSYLETLPKDLQFFLEVRNREWFEENTYTELLESLRRLKVGLIISDNEIRPLLFDLTVPKCWIRYTSSGEFSRLDRWFEKLNEWGAKGLQEAYFFFQDCEDKVQLLDELLYFKNLVDNG
ncbi:DUF72 domain-containing protein [Segetibacter aerophilus]|uniref:DUF72 domain-containing protein n=1 Tax=Segetibacter aerophilus TaxID=670293 RepID=A0A512B9V0_9BACT|nr:DUF72 domain-containing protein [Segetibacter aerophilus]GEO08738.1 hypothetical protein SAE01_12340 [Segetibacter aerophilus]